MVPQYFLTEQNYLCSDGYPGKKITEEYICRNAADWLGYSFRGVVNDYSAPTGCIGLILHRTFWFNNHPRGRRSPTDCQVCKKTGTQKSFITYFLLNLYLWSVKIV